MIALWLACTGEPTTPETGSADTPPSETGTPEASWDPITLAPDDKPPELLSEANLLRWDGSAIAYPDTVLPYDLQTPLFSDFALKDRAIWLPEGQTASWAEDGTVDFPVGTVILKSFLFPADLRAPDDDLRLIETRMLLRGTEEWTSWPYLWRSDGTEADLHVSGDVQAIDFIDDEGQERTAQYLIPQRNQCVDCHDQLDDDGERILLPIGPRARTLSGDVGTQLTGSPPPDGTVMAVDWPSIEASGVDSLSIDEVNAAARDYLDINCAHCHSPRGVEGVTSQFFLNHDNEDQFNLGVCKRPGSAGEGGVDRKFDIVPGDPKQSILWYRTATEDVGAMMPDIGRSLNHGTGSALVWRWIAEMDPNDCEE